MEELLTARQVQEILKVDRITIYRMLSDGRLKGVKIGQQWRFHARELNRLLAIEPILPTTNTVNPAFQGSLAQNGSSRSQLPIHCIQIIQDMYAGLGKIGAVMVGSNGDPLTSHSHLCGFCKLIQSTPAGQDACQKSWASGIKWNPHSGWHTCHAGLRYYQSPIAENGAIVAFLISGPAYHQTPDLLEQDQRFVSLAEKYSIDEQELLNSIHTIPVYSSNILEDIENWPSQFVMAVEAILEERTGLVSRLQKIAEITRQSI